MGLHSNIMVSHTVCQMFLKATPSSPLTVIQRGAVCLHQLYPPPHNCYLTLTIAHIPLRTKPLSKHIMHSAGAPSLLLASGHREGYCSILRSCLSFAKLHSKKKKRGGITWFWTLQISSGDGQVVPCRIVEELQAASLPWSPSILKSLHGIMAVWHASLQQANPRLGRDWHTVIISYWSGAWNCAEERCWEVAGDPHPKEMGSTTAGWRYSWALLVYKHLLGAVSSGGSAKTAGDAAVLVSHIRCHHLVSSAIFGPEPSVVKIRVCFSF